MSIDEEKQTEDFGPPRWLQATAEEFAAVDVNAPLALEISVDTRELSRIFNAAMNAAEEEQKESAARVYAMLGAVCSFHFRPDYRDDPFGPMMQFGDRRTAVPNDFKGAPVEMLAGSTTRFSNPAVRARVADMVWLLDRKRAEAGWQAIDAYGDIVAGVRERRHVFRPEVGPHGYETAGVLRRSIQIARVLGWDDDKSLALRAQVATLRADAAQIVNAGSFRRLATLDLDYRISPSALVGEEAERLAIEAPDPHVKHDLLHIAARARRQSSDMQQAARLSREAAECLVKISEGHGGSGMFEAHWLERAIAEMQNVSGTRERRRELKHRLVDAQSRILDEMTSVSHSEDISEYVAQSRTAVSGKSLVQAMRTLALAAHAPSPAELEAAARQTISDNPLAFMFASTQHDVRGKPVHRDKGMESNDDNAVVQRAIAQAESIRRSGLVQAVCEPVRLTILDEHHVDQDIVGALCSQSPFVPEDRRALFASGILAYLLGDMTAALHILVPQLENSLRHVLRMQGHDVTRLTDDMNQEDLTLSALLENKRSALIATFGDRMVTDIDNLFNNRSGPNLRNRIAHGLIGQWTPHSHDAIYACWLILQLCCIPLHGRWEQLERLHGCLRSPSESGD